MGTSARMGGCVRRELIAFALRLGETCNETNAVSGDKVVIDSRRRQNLMNSGQMTETNRAGGHLNHCRRGWLRDTRCSTNVIFLLTQDAFSLLVVLPTMRMGGETTKIWTLASNHAA